MCSIAEVVRQFKEGWTRQFEDEAILAACQQAGVKWRDRLLTPVYVVKLFLLQILHGNTACEHVPRLADKMFTGEAYCKARSRLRELRYRIARRGCRVKEVTLVTTLVDAHRYSAQELAKLYLQRWQIETDFARLKTTLGMDVLKCKTVEGMKEEALMFAHHTALRSRHQPRASRALRTPRAKRRPKQYPVMKCPRDELKQAFYNQQDAA